jgi:hypothetical protein
MELYDTTIRFLEPREVRISRNSLGKLLLEAEGESYNDVRLTLAFPHTAPDLFVSLGDPDGKEIGVIEDIGLLDKSSRRAIDDELDLVYFSPIIERIVKVNNHYGATSWNVETDKGPQVVRIRERGDVRWLNPHEVVLTDVQGVRYQIPNVALLDENSRSLLEQET